MSHEILFNRAQREALQLPVQYEPQTVEAVAQEPEHPSIPLPYVLGQAAEVREYAARRRDSLLDRGGVRRNLNTEADFVQSAIVSVEARVCSKMSREEASELIGELLHREQGFLNAGREQTGLEPPKLYRRIGSVAAGFARNIEKAQLGSVAS